MKATLLLLVMVVAGFLGGCGHELFVDANNGSGDQRFKKYYGDDSAVETRASRLKSSEMGFGYPSGMGNQ